MANLNGGDSSIVITTDSQPPYTHDPADEPESCNGKIDPGSFVDRASSNGPFGLGDEVKSLGLSKQRVEGETNTKLLSDVKEKQQTIVGVGQNGPSNLDQGNDLPSATATTTDPDLNHNKDDYAVPSLGDCGQDTKELNEYLGEGEKAFDLDQSADHTDNFVFIAICPKRETDTVGEPVESVQNVQGSTREDEFQQEVSPLTENSNANIEVCFPEIEDPINFADQSREHEIELAAPPQAESLMVHTVEVIKSETDLVSAVCGNLEDFIPSPVSSARSEIFLSKDVIDNDLSERIHGCSANTTISRREFELGIADSREVLNFHVDDAKSEVGCLDVEGGDMDSVPSDAEVKLEIEDTNSSVIDSQEIPQNTAFTSQTEISDNSIDTVGKLVESVKNIKESTGEDEIELVAPPQAESLMVHTVEVIKSETDLVSAVCREHEIELAAPPQAESLVVHTVEVIKSETDLVSAVCGNLEDFIPSPVSSARSEIFLSKDVNDNDLSERIHGCSANTTISRREFELGIADSREVLNFHVDDAKSEVGCLDVEGGDMDSVPSDAEVKLEIEDTYSSVIDSQEIPQNTAFTSQTEISDNSIDTVGKLVESVKNIKESTGEDEFQPGASPLTENSNANTGEVNTDEVIKPETDVVSGNLEAVISPPINSERLETMLSKDVNGNELGDSIHGCSANTTISEAEFEHGIADSRELLNFKVDDLQDVTEVVVLDVECADKHSVPSDAVVKVESDGMNSSGIGSQDMPCNSALVSQTEVSDSSIVTGENVPNSVPEMKDVEDRGDQLPVLTEVGILDVEFADTLSVPSDAEVKLQANNMKSFGKGSEGLPCNSTFASQTKVSDSSTVTDEIVSNSVPEVTDVEDQGDQLPVLTEVGIMDVECADTRDAEVKLEPNDMKSPGIGSQGMLCNSVLASQTQVSDSSVVTGDNVSNSVPEMKDVEDQGDQLHVLTEVGILDIECADSHSVPSDVEVKLEANDMNSSGIGSQDMPCNSALVSQTEVSDSSIVTGENVPNSVPEMKDVEDRGDQLPVLTEFGILDVEFADTLSVPSDAEVKLQANNMKSFGKGSEGLPCNSTFASQTKVSDSSTVTDEIVSNSVPEVTDVEDQGDQLPVLTEVGILDVECADTHDAEVKLEPNDMKSPGIGSQGMLCNSVLASQTQVSDSSVVTGDNVSNSVPEMKDVEDQGDQLHVLTEVGILDIECADSHSVPSDVEVKLEANDMNSSDIGIQDLPCNSTLASESEISDSSFITGENVPNSVPEMKDVEDQGDRLPVLDVKSDDKIIGQKSEDLERSHSNENSIADTLAGQDVVITPITRPFQFLFRIPRFDDRKVRDEIAHAELKVDEKTDYRDAFRPEIKKQRAKLKGHTDEYEDAMSNARSSKKSVKSKRAEIESLQAVINKVKNAISVDDIDARIYSMEHMIQHETLPLKEEKQFIREIKQLKQLRAQLSSNIGSQDEVQQAFSKREEIEERLKILKKKLDSLKDSVLKAEAVAREAQKKYEDESKKFKELLSQFGDADGIRQSAYKHLGSLRKELFEKNEHFRMYKKTAAAASNYAASKDREALYHLCRNQVETIMDLWNKNDEFRKEYVKCNVRSTVRRLGTLDGRSLGPDEEPPVLTSYVVERINQFVSKPANTCSVLQTPILKEENQVKPVKDGFAGNNTEVKEREGKSQTTKNGESVKPTLGNGPATFSGRGMNDEMSEMEHIPTKEELELARKAEELRKVESAAKLREQRSLEEKSKALEALERKKRIAEKAQIRAELRAQKEAEQREKEREKRLRKKERKKATGAEVPDLDNSGESTPRSEILTETMKEPEDKETFTSAPKRLQKSSFFFKQSKTKSIPPPLRNRSRRKMQQWMWVIITCMLVICLFVLGNVGFFSNLSNLRQRSYRF